MPDHTHAINLGCNISARLDITEKADRVIVALEYSDYFATSEQQKAIIESWYFDIVSPYDKDPRPIQAEIPSLGAKWLIAGDDKRSRFIRIP